MEIGESKDYVMISNQEYEMLINNNNLLFALESAGVTDWEGYEIAVKMYQDMEDEE